MILDLGKRTYRERFGKLTDEILDTINIESELERLSSGYASKQELEMLDRDITYVLNKVHKRLNSLGEGFLIQNKKPKDIQFSNSRKQN